MATPNGLQQLQIYNDASPNIIATTPREYSGRLISDEEMDLLLIHNIMGFLRQNPLFGIIALPERLRDTFTNEVAAERFPLNFDETNERLLRNSARHNAPEDLNPDDQNELSELKPDISHTLSNTEEQNSEMTGEHMVGRSNSESPILIHGESSGEEDEV